MEGSNILIDDYIKNIKEFNAKGGIGIHHTDTGKTLRTQKFRVQIIINS